MLSFSPYNLMSCHPSFLERASDGCACRKYALFTNHLHESRALKFAPHSWFDSDQHKLVSSCLKPANVPFQHYNCAARYRFASAETEDDNGIVGIFRCR